MKGESKARLSDEDLGKLVRKTFSDSARRHFTTTFGVYNGKQSWVAEWKDLNSWEKQVHIEIARAIKKALESMYSTDTERALVELRNVKFYLGGWIEMLSSDWVRANSIEGNRRIRDTRDEMAYERNKIIKLLTDAEEVQRK